MDRKVFSNLGADIFGLRLQNRMTQQELADLAGTTRQTIARIEKGNGEKVAFGTWAKILDVLGYHFDIERISITLQNTDPSKTEIDFDPLGGYVSWIGE